MKLNNMLLALFVSLSSVYTTAEQDGSVVGMLKTNEYIIVVASGVNGPVYTVKNSAGTVLGDKLSSGELAARFPALEELVNTGVADDARLDLRHLPEELQ